MVHRRRHFQTWISLKPVGQSWSNLTCSITGVGERLHKVLGQIGSKLVSMATESSRWLIMGKMMSPPFLGCLLPGNEDMHKISDKFEFRPYWTTDYGVSCSWASKKFPIDLKWENAVSMLARSFLIISSSKLLVTRTGIKTHTSLISGGIRLLTWVTCPWMTKILHFWSWISLKPVGQSWSNFMCSITGVGEKLHKVLGQIGSKLWCQWQQKAPIDL